MKIMVYATQVTEYEIEVELEPLDRLGAIEIARNAIKDGSRLHVVSFWDNQRDLDFDVHVTP